LAGTLTPKWKVEKLKSGERLFALAVRKFVRSLPKTDEARETGGQLRPCGQLDAIEL
jgi:hypothetical protein